MDLLLNGPPEFILFAIMMTVMVYLRVIMFAVGRSIDELKPPDVEEKKKSKTHQLRRLSRGLTFAMILIFLIILRICSHAVILYLCGSWKASKGLWYHNILPFLDIFILTFLLGLFLYLAWVFFDYDIRPNLQKTGKLKSSQE